MSASYYQILGVAPTASPEELSRAYRQLALQHHPDVGGEAARMVDLNRAYEVLGDPLQRRLYDEYLQFDGAMESPASAGDEAVAVPRDQTPPVESPPAAGEASWALGVLRSLLRLADGLASVLLGIMATDSLPWLICYGLVLLAIAALVNNFFSGLRFP